MKTSKITKIWEITEWTGEHWTTFYIKLDLENWEKISLGKKRKDAFNVWDTVNYEDYVDAKWYTKQREVRENKKPEFKQDQRWYFTSIAFQIGFQNFNSKDDDFQERVFISKRIFAEMLDNYEQKSEDSAPKDEPVSKKEENDLPF